MSATIRRGGYDGLMLVHSLKEGDYKQECEKEAYGKFNITQLICKIVVHWAFGRLFGLVWLVSTGPMGQ